MPEQPLSRMIIWIHKLASSGIDVMLHIYQPANTGCGYRCLVPVQARFDHDQIEQARAFAAKHSTYGGCSYPVSEVKQTL